MAYSKTNTLIARAPRGGFAGWTDTVGDLAKGAITLIGSQQRAAGQAEALATTNAQLMAQQQGKTAGIDTTTLVIGAAAIGGIAFLLLRKKKS